VAQLGAGKGSVIAGGNSGVKLNGAAAYAKHNGGSSGDYVKVRSDAFKASDGTVIRTHAVLNTATGKLYDLKTKIDISTK
jgi:hypothetical protein